MCGIVGLMSLDGSAPPADLIDRMAEAIAHRGPDGRGDYRQGDLAMAQMRLAIIDLKTGDQPLYEPGGAALVANGEIYNYVELREDMPDTAFATASDCEPPLHLFRREGMAFLDRLRGMYTIALHDPVDGRLLLARDPFGIKPLYLTRTERFFAFASEPRAFFAAGLLAPKIAPVPLGEMLQLQFTTGEETPFAGVSRLRPGEALIVSQGRVVE
ncbi:MAG: asparagine synthetase B, partial [Rhodospirillaceae bacterium]|nr:asparagine synthetase B [Rhodospirillaceae bacterium]